MIYETAAPPYMNSKPLVWGLGRELSVHSDYIVPSRIAAMLRRRELCAGLVSAAALFSNPDLQVVPGISISCKGPAESVKLFHKRPLEKCLETVALDESSLSSVLLAKIVLKERYGLNPRFVSMPPVIPDMLDACDAAVTIGDTTMCAVGGSYEEIDLGEEWHGLTGLPFVFAIWAVNPDMASAELVEILSRSKLQGMACLQEIAKAESSRLGLPEDICCHYLSEVMDYRLGARHIEALSLFRKKAREYGVDSGTHEIRLYG